MKTSYILEHQNSVKHPTFRNRGIEFRYLNKNTKYEKVSYLA